MTVLDLSDHDIDQLLSAAEASLANKRSDGADAVAAQSKRSSGWATLTTASASAPVAGGKARKESAKTRSADVTLRVPQQKQHPKKAAPDNAGADWNYMPRTKIEDPKVKRDLQLLRLRGILDPKRHFKKDTRKDPFPEFSQIGTLIEGPLEYKSGRLTRKERKRTLVEEVLASSEAKHTFAARYGKIQEKKTSGRKAHYKKVVARRKRG